MVLARFPTLAGLVHNPTLPPGLSLASSASCEGFTEQQTSFLEPCGQTRTPMGKTHEREERKEGEGERSGEIKGPITSCTGEGPDL